MMSEIGDFGSDFVCGFGGVLSMFFGGVEKVCKQLKIVNLQEAGGCVFLWKWCKFCKVEVAK